MANNGTRAAKLADRIRVIVAETLKTRVKDPRLGFVTITDVRITGDLRDAKKRIYRARGAPVAEVKLKLDDAAAEGGAGFKLRTPAGKLLWKVKIGDTSASELATSLGTVLTFARSGMRYLLVGSVPASAIEAVARGL